MTNKDPLYNSTSVGQKVNERMPAEVAEGTFTCEEHEGEELAFFCADDGSLVCAYCLLVGKHLRHSHIPAEGSGSAVRCFWLKQLHDIDERACEFERELEAASRLETEERTKQECQRNEIEAQIATLSNLLSLLDTKQHGAAQRRAMKLQALQKKTHALLQDTERQVLSLERCLTGHEGRAWRSIVPELEHSGQLFMREFASRRSAIQQLLVQVSGKQFHPAAFQIRSAHHSPKLRNRTTSRDRSKRRSSSMQFPANATHGHVRDGVCSRAAGDHSSQRCMRRSPSATSQAYATPAEAPISRPVASSGVCSTSLPVHRAQRICLVPSPVGKQQPAIKCRIDKERQATHHRLQAAISSLHAGTGFDMLQGATELAVELKAGLRDALLMQDKALILAVVEGLALVVKRHSSLSATLTSEETELVAALM
eukprot:GGOE01025860.1.p1 GENE.GGOE01025860.1~~GGOE01025860.1.p1  ORF type:complete len:440 (-),score=51.73 GGOE01025860.1:304-1581(-)